MRLQAVCDTARIIVARSTCWAGGHFLPARHRARLLCLSLACVVTASPSRADQVQDLAAQHRHGQTFLTWTSPSGVGWTYRVYASPTPITQSADFDHSTLLAELPDSTWCDRRLSVLTASVSAYSIDSLAPALTPLQGLCVISPGGASLVYYAVTSQLGVGSEDRSVTAGENALGVGVQEIPSTPEPVYQRTLNLSGHPTEIYTLWTTAQGTSRFPAMANRPGMAFDCCVVRGGLPPTNSLMVVMHVREGSFLQAPSGGSGYPGEWILGLDDPLTTEDVNSFWYGYSPSYDLNLQHNPIPTTGVVEDYTLRRVVHTVLWARRHFGIDTTRVYARGTSMGGIGSMFLALRRPDLIAAVMTYVGKFDFSFVTDPNPASAFNPGNGLRSVCDRLWGQVTTNLMSTEGLPVYQELNDGSAVGALGRRALPPLIAFNGRNDTTVGWAEKIPFYEAMRVARQGGAFFWDTRDHNGTIPAAWSSMQDAQYLHRFRTNVSFPALSNCSADGNPGNGSAANGDSVGTINGMIEWDPPIENQDDRWDVVLHPRDLTTQWGPDPAPDSATVDVTPRRLQKFRVLADSSYGYSVTRMSDGAMIQQGVVVADEDSLVTVPGVKVMRGGSLLRVWAESNPWTAGAPDLRPPRRLQLTVSPNPAREDSWVRVIWPRADEARVNLFDTGGRLVRALYHGVPDGVLGLRLEPGELPAGLYFVEATQGQSQVVRRLVLLR
jgi:pimeloyl-ACP methyl ester carboxylesterase